MDIFDSLRPFVWPKFREEGPPEFVQSYVLGQDLTGGAAKLDPPTRAVLEMMTIGYRPVSSLAILDILNSSPDLAVHGMQIARELERRFKVKEGWFTRTRYYTDRVGKILPLLTNMRLLEQVDRKDPRTGRVYAAYRISSSSRESLKSRIQAISRGEHVSLFSESRPSSVLDDRDPNHTKECLDCGLITSSTIARYCESCGKPLKARCEKCGSTLEAVYKFCLNCGTKMKWA